MTDQFPPLKIFLPSLCNPALCDGLHDVPLLAEERNQILLKGLKDSRTGLHFAILCQQVEGIAKVVDRFFKGILCLHLESPQNENVMRIFREELLAILKPAFEEPMDVFKAFSSPFSLYRFLDGKFYHLSIYQVAEIRADENFLGSWPLCPNL